MAMGGGSRGEYVRSDMSILARNIQKKKKNQVLKLYSLRQTFKYALIITIKIRTIWV